MNTENENKTLLPEAPETASNTAQDEPQEAPNNNATAEYEIHLQKSRKFPSWMDLFALVGVFVLSVLVGSIVIAVGSLGAEGAEVAVSPKQTLLLYLIQMVPPILFVVLRRRKFAKGNAIHLGFRQVNVPIMLWGIVLLLASSVVIEPLLALFPPEGYDAVTDVLGRGVWSILSVVVCAPILEEILFRGLVFESCRERFGGGAAVLISALLFGLIHGVPVQVINAFVVGIILGYIYLRIRSLINVILLHAINNALAYLTMGLGADTLKELISAGWLYWTIYVVASVIFVLSMVKVLVTLRDNRELE